MTFDRPGHQVIVAKILNEALLPGGMAELVVELKQAVAAAEIAPAAKKKVETVEGGDV